MATAPTPAPEARPRGRVDGQLVYAIGDVHGCYEAFRRLLARISDDARRTAKGRTTSLIFCGDYVDRGPGSRQVLDALCWLKRHRPFPVHFLKGNHEQVMLDYLAEPYRARSWMRFGGIETLLSYGVAAPGPDDPAEAHVAARDDLLERMPVSHLHFLRQLDLMIGVGDYVFVHAGVRPGVALSEQAEADLLWIREDFLDCGQAADRIVVHGHTWLDDQPQIRGHRIGIDTGAYATGVLTAVRLEDDGVDFLSTR